MIRGNIVGMVKVRDRSFILCSMVRDERPLFWAVSEYYNCFRIRFWRIEISSNDGSDLELSFGECVTCYDRPCKRHVEYYWNSMEILCESHCWKSFINNPDWNVSQLDTLCRRNVRITLR